MLQYHPCKQSNSIHPIQQTWHKQLPSHSMPTCAQSSYLIMIKQSNKSVQIYQYDKQPKVTIERLKVTALDTVLGEYQKFRQNSYYNIIKRIFPSMEEIVSSLKHFFEAIYTTEKQTDDIIEQFNANPHASPFILHQLPSDQQGKITVRNLAQYFQSKNSSQISESLSDIMEVLSSYFKFPKSGTMDIREFRNQITSKKQQELPISDDEDIQTLFDRILVKIVSGFKMIEDLRKTLCQYRQGIESFFQEEYSSEQQFTREILRDFMYDHGIYSKKKFNRVSWYIFGDQLDSINWNLFLTEHHELNQKQVINIQPLVNAESESNTWRKSQSFKKLGLNGEWDQQKQQGHKQGEEVSGLNDLLSQISDIENRLAHKKNKRSQNIQVSPISISETLKTASSQLQQEKPASSQKTKTYQETKDPGFFTAQTKWLKKHQFSGRQSSEYVSKLYNKYFDTEPSTLHQLKRNSRNHKSKQNNMLSMDNYHKLINRSSSQAHLKIQQIKQKVNSKLVPKQTYSYSLMMNSSKMKDIMDKREWQKDKRIEYNTKKWPIESVMRSYRGRY